MLWDRALRWFIKWIDANPNASIDLVKNEYIQEFKLCHQINKDWRNLLDIHQWEGKST